MKTILLELAVALILEAARNTVITQDPPSIETSIGPFHFRLDFGGFSFWCEWTVPQTHGYSNNR
jgi:hypothetical protein